MAATESFFDLLGQAFKIAKQHWLAFLVCILVTFFAITFSSMVVGGIILGSIAAGGGAIALVVAVIATLLIVGVVIFSSLAMLKVVHLAISNKSISFTEVLAYTAKNFFSFVWAMIVGTVYAVRWGLLLVCGVPVVYAVMTVMSRQAAMELATTIKSGNVAAETLASGPLAMMGAIKFGLAIAAVVGIIWIIIASVKIVFLGYAFVADEKHGIEAAKTSTELVKGRWWKTFGYNVFVILLLSIAMAIIGAIVELMLDADIRAIFDSIFAQLLTIIIVTFNALMYGAWKRSRG